MRVNQLKRPLPRVAIRRGDGLRLAIATAGLLAALVAVFFTASYTLQSVAASSAAKAALAAQAQKAAEAQLRLDAHKRRVGSIVLAADRGRCEELRFDNFTGAFISIADVDCDRRIDASVTAPGPGQDAGAGMASMLKSFQK